MMRGTAWPNCKTTKRGPRERKSELVIEGHPEPRVDESGKLYIAVIACVVPNDAVASKNQQAARKLEQLREEVVKTKDVYDAACDQFGVDSAPARAALDALEKLKANLVRFMSNHPEQR